jgi:protein gp37
MNKTKIEWCDSTLNPVVGCTYGCDFCYARKMNSRFGWVKDFSKPQFFNERLEKLNSKNPKNIFMDSMSDIADWEMDWIDEVFKVIKNNPQHNYLFLSKRPERIYENWLQFIDENIWCGATGVGNHTANKSLYYLDCIKGCNTFLSLEPLLDEIQLTNELAHINWVIIGAETGNRKGKVTPRAEWVKAIVLECDKYSIPIFMKESILPVVGEGNMRREFPEGLKRS